MRRCGLKTSLSIEDRAEDEMERLRQALDAETQARAEVQGQLDRANAEFEAFVSTAAHDLREPLRDVASCSQLITETYAGRLDSDAGVYLERIREGAARMQSLLAGVVDYWTADAGGGQPAPTDMEAVLRQALLSADRLITERGAIVTHDPVPAVTGDFDMLTKVMRHLIGNAIEYCGALPPRVQISAKRQDLEWVFSVQDNGPGIEPAFQDRIFGAFKRLHGKEHPGNGLGLAFCKKAMEWHGGRMWVESAPGAGSTFYFTLLAVD
jgi:light-regulated signal transduction histidine kinase (bacteriophytochrome)